MSCERSVQHAMIVFGCLGALVAICAEFPLSAQMEYLFSKCVPAGTAKCKDCMDAIASDSSCPPGGTKGYQCFSMGGNPQSTTNFTLASCEFANSAQYDCATGGLNANVCVNIPYYKCPDDCAVMINGQLNCGVYCDCGGMSQGNGNFKPLASCT